MTDSKQPAEACSSAGKPKQDTYEPLGEYVQIEDIFAYSAGPLSQKKAIIVFYDIFGWNSINKNVFRVCDRLAKDSGCHVLMPDFYRSDPFPIAEFPPKTAIQKELFSTWLRAVASEKRTRKDIYEKVLPYLYKLNMNSIAALGFCWGGKQAFLMGKDADRFKAIATFHATWITTELTQQLQVPVLYCPTKNDSAVGVVQKGLSNKKFRNKCEYLVFNNEIHGFMTARGDWKNKITEKAVESAFTKMLEYFQNNL